MDEGWVESQDLEIDDALGHIGSGMVRVAGLEWLDRRGVVYNFEVDGDHTYFVGETGVWVHNSCGHLPQVRKAVNSKLPHAIDRGISRGVFSTRAEASQALKGLSKQISASGFPRDAVLDSARADRVLVPIGNQGMAAYQVLSNGTTRLKTVLIAL